MTHGVGSFGGGGGGGGGCSGGSFAFTTTHVYSSTKQSRRRRGGKTESNSENCCGGCITALCRTVLFLLCLGKMERNTRLRLLWFYAVSFSVLAGVLFFHQYSGSDTVSISPGDMRLVDTRSALLNENLIFHSNVEMLVYTFEHQPRIQERPTRFYEKGFDTVINTDSYEYWGFYLLKGSVVSSRIDGPFGIQYYVIKGKANLDKFIKDSSCVECYLQRVYITGMQDPMLITNIDNTDEYYFLFANPFFLEPGRVSVDFHVNRTLYDTNAGALMCESQFDCRVWLDMSHDQNIVYDVSDTTSFDADVFIKRNPRIYIYVLFFGVFPFIIGILLTYIIVRKYRLREASKFNSNVFIMPQDSKPMCSITSDRAPLVQTLAPPPYSGVPPSYDQALAPKV